MVESLFSYRKGFTVLHKINPSLKFACFVFSSILLFSQKLYSDGSAVWIKTVVLFAFVSAAAFAARTSFSSLKSLRVVLLLGLCVTLFRMIQAEYVDSRWVLSLDYHEMKEGLLYTARFLTASLAALVFFETTSPLELQESLDAIQNQCSKLLPILRKFSLSLYLILAVSFIPEVFSVWNGVKLASRARNPMSTRKQKKIALSISIFFLELSALLSIMIQKAVEKRKALLNRMHHGN